MHYFFRTAPPSQPQHDRFAKGSYVYLYYSAVERRAKLEIANHAGTPDQDAFYGYLDAVQQLSYSSKHPTLCTLVIDQPHIKTQAEWHLPTWDDRNEKRWLHKLHSLDLYFWTERDASTFMTQLNAVVPAEKLDLGGASSSGQAAPAEHPDSMSSVVQQLERTAIGAQFPPRAGSTTSAVSLPGPPTPASTNSTLPPPPQAAPMAYNPASPAAPEPISHREKTPPPSDGATGNGLTHAANYGAQQQAYLGQQHPQQYTTTSLQSTPQSSYFPGPPQAAAPAQQASQQQPSFGPHAASTITQYASYPASSHTPGIASPGVTSPGVYQQQPPTPSAPPAPPTYMSLQSPGLPPPPSTSPPAQHSGQQPQVAGFSSYSYSPAAHPPTPGHYTQAGAFTGNVHSQTYRPTEEEAAHGHHSKPRPQAQSQSSFDDKYRISERVNRMEKGIGGFLKKLDQKF